MQSNAVAVASANTIEQYHVDVAADELMSRGVRPTIMKVQEAIGGDREVLVGFLEDWARRLHCRITGRTVGDVPDALDRVDQEKADLELMRQADSLQKKALRAQQAQRQRASVEAIERDESAMRRRELLTEIQKMEQKVRGFAARKNELESALKMTEANHAAAELRLKNLKFALHALPPTRV